MKTRLAPLFGHEVARAILAAMATAGCMGEVMVGEVGGTGGDGSTCESCGGAGPTVDCSDHDERVLAPHARWKATANDFGDLAPSGWVGSFSNTLRLTLTIDEDHQGTVQVGGTVPPPMRDTAYVEMFGNPLPIGALYELHGAGFDGTTLLVPLPLNAPYEEWCPLQLSFPLRGSDCSADLLPYATSCDGQVCTTEGRTISQSYVLATYGNPCACTLTGCVASVAWPEFWEAGKTYADYQNYFSVEALVLTYDPETDTLSGGLFEDGSPPDGMPIELQRTD